MSDWYRQTTGALYQSSRPVDENGDPVGVLAAGWGREAPWPFDPQLVEEREAMERFRRACEVAELEERMRR